MNRRDFLKTLGGSVIVVQLPGLSKKGKQGKMDFEEENYFGPTYVTFTKLTNSRYFKVLLKCPLCKKQFPAISIYSPAKGYVKQDGEIDWAKIRNDIQIHENSPINIRNLACTCCGCIFDITINKVDQNRYQISVSAAKCYLD